MSEPFISVIIPARNESKLIPRCLEALQAQQYPQSSFEVIVVDNASTDDTALQAAAGRARVVQSPGPTIAALRNLGVKESKGEFLAFIDADCLAAPDWLQRVASVLGEEDCITGGECSIAKSDPWVAQAWFCLQPKGRVPVRCIPTNNLVVSRKVFDAAGGFNEKLVTGEDCEFCLRAGKLVPVIADESFNVVHLGTPKTLRQFFRRELWHGLGALGTFRQHWFDKPLLGTFGFIFCTLLQIFGLVALRVELVSIGTIGVLSLLGLSVWYRRRYLRDIKHAFQLGALYYFFYLARALAFVVSYLRKGFYHNNR